MSAARPGSVQDLRRAIARSYREDDLLRQVIEIAHAAGWLCHHCRPARTKDGHVMTPIQGDVGFPDLVLAREGRVIFAELKAERGRRTAAQVAWGTALVGDGVRESTEVYLWRPSDLNVIERTVA